MCGIFLGPSNYPTKRIAKGHSFWNPISKFIQGNVSSSIALFLWQLRNDATTDVHTFNYLV